MGLGGKVLEEQSVHRALEADMQFGDFALGQGDDANPGEGEVLEENRHVGLIATDPIQRLGQHDLEFSGLGILQRGLNTGAQSDAGSGNGRILIGGPHRPPLPLSPFPADADLVFDRRNALII